MNAQQTILTILNDAERPMRKEGIASLSNYTILTTVQALAALGKTKSITQSKGFYSITPVGRQHIESDKFLTAFTTNGGVAQLKPFDIDLPLKLIAKSAMCQQVLRMKEVFPEHDKIDEELLPFVLMWLAYHKYELPEYSPDKVIDNELDEFRGEVITYVTTSLVINE